MSEKTASLPPLGWIRKIDRALQLQDTTPLFGKAPFFDLNEFTKALSEQLSVSNISIEKGEAGWRSVNALLEGYGDNPMLLAIAVAPLEGHLIWAMPEGEVAQLASWLLNPSSRGLPIESPMLQEGFYRYVALEVLDVLQKMEMLTPFHLQLQAELPEEHTDGYCMDLCLKSPYHSYWGRLIISAPFFNAWERYFASQSPSLSFHIRELPVPISIRAGSVSLTQAEWNTLEIGDFVVLDRTGYLPRKQSGVGYLFLGVTPLFQVQIQTNQIEIRDYAHFYEETMSPEQDEPSEDEIQSFEETRNAAIEAVPLSVAVELGRFQMTVKELMNLTPGNFKELPIQPQQGVSLTINGNIVGKAELVYLGDVLGIRILEIGQTSNE